jgi:RNA polymerase sigma factor (sigma-70 family)
MIDIVSVGNQKLDYQDHSGIEFESLDFYINLAQKTISKFGKNFSSNIAKEMLSSEDAISNVANAIMMADWRWDKDRKGETGQQKTKYSYRNQCAIWAIQSYVTRKKKKSRKKLVEVYHDNKDKELSLLDIVSDGSISPIDSIIDSEQQANLKQYFETILSESFGLISEKQAQYIKLYYFDNMTFSDIGKKFNVTREAVRQGIKKALEKIRNISE